jgi:hypothetical protein
VFGTNPNTQKKCLPFPHKHAHTHKTETKRTIKIKTQKIVLIKPKKGKKETNKKQQR